MSEVALLPNTNRPQQVEDYVRGCTTTKYWPPSTSWRLCQRLHYYQILTDLNKLKIMSEVALLLPNTDRPQQVQNYVRGCTTSTKYWRFQQVEDYVRGCTTSTKYWPTSTGWKLCQRLHYFYQILTISTSWRLCQRLHYFYQILTDLNRFKIMSEVALLLPNTDDFNKLKIMSEVALLLPNTDLPQQVENYVRGCTTSIKY